MLQDFHLIHRRRPAQFESPNTPVWSTCLRHLAFVRADFAPAPGDEMYSGASAYRFLLEVVCGLQSPVWGETEVFGQFKVFSAEWLKHEQRRASLVQKILNDAKAIRTEFLLNLGTQSYGGWVRKNLCSERVHVVGAGILAREILPYLQKRNLDLRVHVRDVTKVNFFNGPVLNIADEKYDGGAVIVAAPLAREDLMRWLGDQAAPTQVFDLRGDADPLPLPLRTQVFLLSDIFAQIEATKSRLRPRMELVQQAILARSERAAAGSLLRPMGWDDLCA